MFYAESLLVAQAISLILTHFSAAWSVYVSYVVCHIRGPCLNRLTDSVNNKK